MVSEKLQECIYRPSLEMHHQAIQRGEKIEGVVPLLPFLMLRFAYLYLTGLPM